MDDFQKQEEQDSQQASVSHNIGTRYRCSLLHDIEMEYVFFFFWRSLRVDPETEDHFFCWKLINH
jgi:hypothetical protein